MHVLYMSVHHSASGALSVLFNVVLQIVTSKMRQIMCDKCKSFW